MLKNTNIFLLPDPLRPCMQCRPVPSYSPLPVSAGASSFQSLLPPPFDILYQGQIRWNRSEVGASASASATGGASPRSPQWDRPVYVLRTRNRLTIEVFSYNFGHTEYF